MGMRARCCSLEAVKVLGGKTEGRREKREQEGVVSLTMLVVTHGLESVLAAEGRPLP